ncbi:hypothetical protein ACN263_04550 [Micromonospora sp. WMMD729]|uniref:hypothetical protein n=1 Tax=Micromonospora sp. WMMD729 TaxID=3404127 RepID=UPI003BF4F09F
MQPESPYRYTHMLGACQIGKAWAALDGEGRFATVAVLDGVAASDKRWREAFGNAANALAQADDGHRYADADFTAAHPWAAYPAQEGHAPQRLFQSLGMDYQPVADSPVSGPPSTSSPVSGVPEQVSGPPVPRAPELVHDMPALPWAVHVSPDSGQPVSASPHPVSGAPTSPATVTSSPPAPRTFPTSGPGGDAFASPVRRITPSAPSPRRTGLWIGVAALVLVVLAGAGGLIVWANGDDDPKDVTASPSAVAVPPTIATSPPQSPGVEPPQAGTWPAQWPKFTDRDNVKTLTGLEGLTFPVKVPMDWGCTLAGRAEGFVKYNCGTPAGGPTAIGGELVVRDCLEPCDTRRQASMRQAEDAWSLQWMSGGTNVTYAESSQLKIDGEQRYGLVIVAYWRGGESGRLDHQLVFRMTAPVDGANRLRRVGNYLRDVALF